VAGSVTRISPWQLAWRPSESSAWLLGGEYRVSIAGLVELGPEQKPVSSSLLPASFTHLASGSEKHIVASVPPETPPRDSSAFGNTTLFQGRLWVPELGLYYYRARWYDPQLVNFIERDPAGYADSPNLMQAFGLNPVSNRDPWGRWVIPPDAGPAWSENDPDSIPNIARKLLRHPLSLEYLRYRFGEPAKKGTLASMAGLSVEAELENAIKPGSGPRVEFDTARLKKAEGRGLFQPKPDTIFLATADRDPELFHLGVPAAVAPSPMRLGIRVAIASLLGHETVHYLSSRFTREAWKGMPCSKRRPGVAVNQIDNVTFRATLCWSLHDDALGGLVLYDIGSKWQIMVLGDPYSYRALPPLEPSPEWALAEETRYAFAQLLNEYDRLIMNHISGEELRRRKQRIFEELKTESPLLKFFPLEPEISPWGASQ
jgi:RHS repeat-associated protein